MVGIHIRWPLNRLSKRAINAWYLLAFVASLPGVVLGLGPSLGMLLFGSSLWEGYPWAWAIPAVVIAALVSAAAAVLGFLNRRRTLDTLAAAGLAVYATTLAAVALLQLSFLIAFSE